MASYCYFLPQGESDSNLRLVGDAIESSFSTDSYNFDKIFPDDSSFSKHAYNAVLSNLVTHTIEGESTILVLGGSVHDRNTPIEVLQNLVAVAANQLLESVNTRNGKIGSVTFDWFKIDCGNPEVVSDTLKSVSAQNVADNGSLVLRELGRGRGMTVPGLWEVEVSNGKDIDAVINHIQKLQENEKPQNKHTIMQLIVTSKSVQDEAAKSKSAHKANPTLLGDSPGIGRITFVLLSNLSSSSNITSLTPKCAWVDLLKSILQWIGDKRTSPPFHKSRILLLLKDFVQRRQKGALLLFLEAEATRHEVNLEWIKLFSAIRYQNPSLLHHRSPPQNNNNTPAASAGVTASASAHHHQQQQHHAPQQSQSAAEELLSSHLAFRGGDASSLRDKLSLIHGKERPTKTPITAARSSSEEDAESALIGAAAGGYSAKFAKTTETSKASATAGKSHPGKVVPPPPKRSALLDDLHGLVESDALEASREFSAYRHAQQQQQHSFAALDVDDLKPISQQRSPSPSKMSPNGAMFSSNIAAPLSAKSATSAKSRTAAAAAMAEQQEQYSRAMAEEARKQEETIHALQLALEGSRNEAAALKIAYNYANEKYEETKGAYDSLIGQLKEEGSMLAKRDRERYRSAVKDIRDYEIYKNVMESAMVRLQKELEDYAKENAELKLHRVSDEKTARKQKSFSEQYSKDLCATKKKLAETTNALQHAEKQIKSLIRDRDVAVATLAQVKSNESKREGQVRIMESFRQTEVDELQRKLQRAEERVSALDIEKSSILAAHNKEISSLRAAHTKALETILSYQSENDTLRDKVSQLTSAVAAAQSNKKEAAREVPKPPSQHKMDIAPPPAFPAAAAASMGSSGAEEVKGAHDENEEEAPTAVDI